jgi:hypothetical protein
MVLASIISLMSKVAIPIILQFMPVKRANLKKQMKLTAAVPGCATVQLVAEIVENTIGFKVSMLWP